MKLAIWATFKEVLASIVSDNFYLIRISWPILLTSALSIIFTLVEEPLYAAIPAIASLFLFMPLCNRIMEYLVDGTQRSGLGALSISARQAGLYIVYGLFIILAALPPIALLFLVFKGSLFFDIGLFLTVLFFILPVTFILMFAYPAIATNREVSIKGAFRQLKGNTIRYFSLHAITELFIVLIGVAVGAALVLFGNSLTEAQTEMYGDVANTLITVPTTVLLYSAIAISYRKLVKENPDYQPQPADSTDNIDPNVTS